MKICGKTKMPYKIRKVKNKRCYSVKSPKRVHAKCTSKKKAEAQVRLLGSVESKKRKKKNGKRKN